MSSNTAPSFTISTRTGASVVDVGGDAQDDYALSIAVQSDGKLVLVGYSGYYDDEYVDHYDHCIIRLNADGTLDTSFSGDGQLLLDIGAGVGADMDSDKASSVVVQRDGKLVVAGTVAGTFSVIRLNTDGTLDSSFSDDGKFSVVLAGDYDWGEASCLLMQDDGKLVVGGYSGLMDYDYSIIRLNADGTLDTSFSGDGKLMMDLGTEEDAITGIAVQNNGKLVLVGYSGDIEDYDWSVARLNADGTPDTSFSDDGKLILDMRGDSDAICGVVVQTDGKLVLAGHTGDYFGGCDYSVIRLNADGTLDTSFSGDGLVTVDLSSEDDLAHGLALQSDGKIVVAGSTGVIRLTADGTLDTSFSGDGISPIPNGQSVRILSDGKIVLAGGYGQFITARLNADGSLDSSFGPTVLIDTLGGTATYTEGSAAIALDSSAAIVDAELSALNGGAGNYAGASVTLARHGGASNQDVFSALGKLSFSSGKAVLSGTTIGTVSNTGGTLKISFNSNATQARVNEALSSIGYANTSEAPAASAQIDWTFSDGALSTTGSTTVKLVNVNDAPTGSVKISGSAAVGQTLTASHTLADLDGLGTVSYQWLRGGKAISGATGSSYTLTGADKGQAISVQASYTDGLGTPESQVSAATSAVVGNAPPSFALPARTGSSVVDINLYDRTTDVIVQSDGKLVLASWSGSNADGYDYGVIRLNADGTLDTSFSGDGKLMVGLGTAEDLAYSVTMQSDGKLVLAGRSGYFLTGTDYSVIRLNSDGTLDTSFSDDGKHIVDLGADYDTAHSVIVQRDGKLVLAGKSGDGNGDNPDYSVIRLNADGTLDTSFSGDGKLVLDLGMDVEVVRSVIEQGDGKLLLVGWSGDTDGYDYSVIRLNADGTLDTSFSSNGKRTIDLGTSDDRPMMTIMQSDGKLLLAGWSGSNVSGYDYSMIRLNSDGTLDTSFSGDGKLTVDTSSGNDDGANDMTLQSDGKIVLVGDNGVIRLNANGTLDTSFSGDGISTAASGNNIQVLSDGKIVVTSGEDNYVVTRLNADGSLDTSFGDLAGSGAAINTLGGTVSYTENAAAIALDSSVAIMDVELSALGSGAGNYAGASVTLARHGGANAQDVFSALGKLSFSSGKAVLSGTTIGTVSNTGGTLKINFNSNATQARVNEALSSLGYANTSNTPSARVQIDWTFNDGNTGSQGTGGALSTTGSTTVKITTVRDDITKSGTSGNDTLVGDTIEANSYDRLSGLAGNDSLSGLGGNDTLDGGAGNDTLNGGSGADSMTGGDGSDTYYVNTTGDKVIETNATTSTGGTDLVLSSLAAYTLTANVENGRITASGTASLSGNSLNNLLYAGAGNNVLSGGSGIDTAHYGYASAGVTVNLGTTTAQNTINSGSDTLSAIENLTGSKYNDKLTGSTAANKLDGGVGNDVLSGSSGNDTLLGGDGNDTLIGGAGQDSLTGGAGNDLFDFNALTELGLGSTTRDVITDFAAGTDRIDLSTIDANAALTGNQAFQFVSSFTTTAGQVRYAGGIVYLNTDSDTAAEYEIQLTGTVPASLTAASFVL